MRPALDLQLKATVNLRASADGDPRFPLPLRNYDLLRLETQTPRLLVVLELPSDPGQWVTITDDALVLRHRAYWLNLRGQEETGNQSSVTVQISRQNLFNVESLRALMDQSRGGSSNEGQYPRQRGTDGDFACCAIGVCPRRGLEKDRKLPKATATIPTYTARRNCRRLFCRGRNGWEIMPASYRN